MSRTPLPKAETNDPLVRTMRETCVRITDRAEDANFLTRPFMIMLAELLCRIFGKIEDLVVLWRAGLIPPSAPKPAPAPRRRARKIRNESRRARINHRTPVLRLLREPVQQSRAAAGPFAIDRGQTPPRKPAPARRIDRYPKPPNSRQNQWKTKS